MTTIDLPPRSRSYWLDSTPTTDYPVLDRDVTADIAVVGAGIAGISTAYFLVRDGYDVALLDRSRVVNRVTGHTTAKLTANHGITYQKLIDRFGERKAQLYADANQAAIETVQDLAVRHGIDSNLSETPAYTYAVTDEDTDELRDEVDAAQRLDLPAVYVDDVPAPVDAAGAVRFDDQVQFHPRKYLLGLLDAIKFSGGKIYEQTAVTDLQPGDPHTLVTEGGTVKADDVVLTTHFPFRDTGLYFARMYPQYSYLLGAELTEEPPEAMYYSTAESFHSFRPQPLNGENMLLIGGQPHQTGHAESTLERYQQVAQFATDTFPVETFRYRWATQDYMTIDDVPYIGRLSPVADSLYVGTGFKGWGMTHGTITGLLLTDLIAGRDNAWHELYTPNRVGPLSGMKTFVKENVHNTVEWVSGRRKTPKTDQLPDLAPDTGKIVEIDGDQVAVYRDEDGEYHVVSAVCTHMQCILSWNDAERTWDCPCHGSRFNHDGSVIDGPAQERLPEKDVAEESDRQ